MFPVAGQRVGWSLQSAEREQANKRKAHNHPGSPSQPSRGKLPKLMRQIWVGKQFGSYLNNVRLCSEVVSAQMPVAA